jgi:hypothetical protein
LESDYAAVVPEVNAYVVADLHCWEVDSDFVDLAASSTDAWH